MRMIGVPVSTRATSRNRVRTPPVSKNWSGAAASVAGFAAADAACWTSGALSDLAQAATARAASTAKRRDVIGRSPVGGSVLPLRCLQSRLANRAPRRADARHIIRPLEAQPLLRASARDRVLL